MITPDFIQLLSAPIFHQIGEVADTMGVECYVVGGYVRDLFLQRPSKDIDVVVVGSGIDVAEALCKHLNDMRKAQNVKTLKPATEPLGTDDPKTQKPKNSKTQKLPKAYVNVFRNFGTAQLKYGNTEVEFVGARRESYNRDSRKPIVENGTLEDDQRRRDFTINAMAVCLNKERFGELVDPFDGVLDLDDHLIATPLDPDTTFSDDPLRMMRAVRFATQLGFHIEETTFDGLERNAERIKIISQERIIDELNKIMASANPSRGFVELSRCGLLPLIFPELAALEGVEKKNGIGHKDNFYHTLQVLDTVARQAPIPSRPFMSEDDAPHALIDDHNLWLRWAALLHDIGKPRTKRFEPSAGWTFKNHNYIGAQMVPTIFRRMKLPTDARMDYVQRLVLLHMRPASIADEGVSDSAVRRLLFESNGSIDDLMLLAESDLTTHNALKKASFLASFQNVRDKLADLQARDQIRLFQPCIDGNEIMQIFNLPPSLPVGQLKKALKDAIIDGAVENTREAALAFLHTKAAQMGI